jgi:hypothetical protein
MNTTKEEFIRSFLPDSVRDLEYTSINLDITDLSIADILRNLNKTYAINTRARNAIISGNMVVCVLCKTDTIEPLKGIFIVLTNEELEMNFYSSQYLVLCISECNITTDSKIVEVSDNITDYLANNFDGVISNLADFYRKFVYDPDEYIDDYVDVEYI